MDLADGRPDERPILRGDALKFVVLFRSQLAPELIIECVSGAPPTEPPDPSRSIIRFLGSSHLILHHYVAYALERLLLLRFSGATIWHQVMILFLIELI